MSFVYLASPYSHADPDVRLSRYDKACEKAARLMEQGYSVVSPIAQSHNIAFSLPEEIMLHHDFWMHQDLPIVECASEVIVLTLFGWEESKGVKAEIRHAKDIAIPVEYHDMQGLVFPHGH